MAMSLTDPANRKAFVADEDSYLRKQGLTDTEIAMVRERDWKAMIAGGWRGRARVRVESLNS